MLDEETREYRVYAENTLCQKPKTDDDKKTKKKFGNFMGKLLLQSGKSVTKPTPKVSKEKTLKQQVLTEEPFVGLFRMRKNRSDQTQDLSQNGGISKDGIKISLKLTCQTSPKQNCIELDNHNNQDTGIKNIPKYRLMHGRRTRWDIQNDNTISSTAIITTTTTTAIATAISTNTTTNTPNTVVTAAFTTSQSPVSFNDNVDMNNHDSFLNFDDSDSYSMSESLQSDDDVLGPWIELGMIDSEDRRRLTEALNNRQSCQHHLSSLKDELNVCSECKTEQIESPQVTAIKPNQKSSKSKSKNQKKVTFEETAPSVKKQKLVNNAVKKISSSKATANNAASVNKALNTSKKCLTTVKKVNNKYSKPIIPPTKSRYSQKTNRKMMASKKNENMTIQENSEKKSDATKKDSVSHFTTGAFMTRKTARTLADPEHGFYPNIHGFVHRQNVEVLNINGYWYPGTLEMMNKGKVKVKYSDWDDQEEWIIMGSRRLRVASTQNESPSKQSNDVATVDEDIDITFIDENGKHRYIYIYIYYKEE